MVRKRRRAAKQKESITMPPIGDIPKVNGIPVAGEAGGYIATPEHISHFYDINKPAPEFPGLYDLQVVAVGYDSAGAVGGDFPERYRSPLYHRAVTLPGDYWSRRAAQDDAGHITKAGLTTGPWTMPDGTEAWPPGPHDDNRPEVYVGTDGVIVPVSGTTDPAKAAALVALAQVASYLQK